MTHLSFTLKLAVLGLTMSLTGCNDNSNTPAISDTNHAAPTTLTTKTLESNPSPPVNNTLGRLETPAGFEANLAADGIRLHWLPTTDTAISYRVYWSEQPDVTTASPYVDVYESRYLHSGIIPSATYHFRVSAWRDNRESALSTMLIVPTVPPQTVGSDAAE